VLANVDQRFLDDRRDLAGRACGERDRRRVASERRSDARLPGEARDRLVEEARQVVRAHTGRFQPLHERAQPQDLGPKGALNASELLGDRGRVGSGAAPKDVHLHFHGHQRLDSPVVEVAGDACAQARGGPVSAASVVLDHVAEQGHDRDESQAVHDQHRSPLRDGDQVGGEGRGEDQAEARARRS
jgi:hypothetical protein